MQHVTKHYRLKEFLYQSIFGVVLFLTYGINKHNETLHWYDIIFFLTYVSAAVCINYALIPKLFYKKKSWLFWSIITGILLALYGLEEFVLEPLFVGGKRAAYVSNIFYTLLGIAPYIFMMVGFKLALDAIEKQRKLEHLQLQVRDSELRFLKSQINPHFLFNNLNNLYAYAIENSSKTPTIILELSSVLRYMLYDCKADFVPLTKEIEHLKNFTALNELQIEDRGTINFNANITADAFCIAPLILTVFIENAFKHSMASQTENINIAIDVYVSPTGMLRFTCVNNFLDTSNNQNLSQGIGLENVQKRLALLYPKAHDLNIDIKTSTYSITLNMQLKESLC